MLDAIVSAVTVVALGIVVATYAFPFGVLFTLFRMDDMDVRRMDHYLDFPSVFFDDGDATKDYLAVLGVHTVASAVLAVVAWTPFVLLSIVGIPLAMFGPMQSYGRRKQRLLRGRRV